MEVHRVEKSNVWMEVALRTHKWADDDSKLVEFLTYGIPRVLEQHRIPKGGRADPPVIS